MEKDELLSTLSPQTDKKGKTLQYAAWSVILSVLVGLSFASIHNRQITSWTWASLQDHEVPGLDVKVVRQYNLTVGARWMNLDGGRWRPMFVCNGESPCPTLTAQEGDQVDIHVINDLGAQLSIHWSGMSHRRLGFWNDGTGGLNQFPILPRGNWTSSFDATGHWGLNWYADHSGAGVADGVYGMIYVAPSHYRPRPYSQITESRVEQRLMRQAEVDVQHVALWNSDFRTVDWKLTKMKAKGTSLSCYKSILVNGKGRVFCKNSDYAEIDGQALDDAGCVVQFGQSGDSCAMSDADFQVIETRGQPYVMINLVNVGFEHALKISIDDHSFWVVADDSGFVQPQIVEVLYITNGARFTILVKTNLEPKDYSIRLASASKLQNLEGLAILRYPAKRYPLLGFPMELPEVTENTKVCLNPDASARAECKELDAGTLRTYPASVAPKKTDVTLLWRTGSRPSPGFDTFEEYFVNEKPWQLFRAAMEPVFFTEDATHVEKPIQNNLPMGTVVDLVVQNALNETIPMYKHGDPTFRLGSVPYSEFKWSSISEALEREPAKSSLNVKDPPLGVVHDLPPLGWLAIRWQVNLKGATMFHAVKLRYFALGMAAPLLEGFEHSMAENIPQYAKEQPHVLFEPKNDGIFG